MEFRIGLWAAVKTRSDPATNDVAHTHSSAVRGSPEDQTRSCPNQTRMIWPLSRYCVVTKTMQIDILSLGVWSAAPRAARVIAR